MLPGKMSHSDEQSLGSMEASSDPLGATLIYQKGPTLWIEGLYPDETAVVCRLFSQFVEGIYTERFSVVFPSPVDDVDIGGVD